jgi:hypothetical protein
MAKNGHREEEILRVLRKAESGGTAVEICRRHGISQQSLLSVEEEVGRSSAERIS